VEIIRHELAGYGSGVPAEADPYAGLTEYLLAYAANRRGLWRRWRTWMGDRWLAGSVARASDGAGATASDDQGQPVCEELPLTPGYWF
jgi:hypothetical protein